MFDDFGECVGAAMVGTALIVGFVIVGYVAWSAAALTSSLYRARLFTRNRIRSDANPRRRSRARLTPISRGVKPGRPRDFLHLPGAHWRTENARSSYRERNGALAHVLQGVYRLGSEWLIHVRHWR